MFERLLSDAQVEKRYVATGAAVGNALSYWFMGECAGFQRMRARWEKWEREYARRGYRTISTEDFMLHGGYGSSLMPIGMKRDANEKPLLYAPAHRK